MRLEAVAKSRDSLVGNLRDAENRYADAAASLQQASAREVALKAELERAYEIARAGEHAQQVHGVMLLSLDTDIRTNACTCWSVDRSGHMGALRLWKRHTICRSKTSVPKRMRR